MARQRAGAATTVAGENMTHLIPAVSAESPDLLFAHPASRQERLLVALFCLLAAVRSLPVYRGLSLLQLCGRTASL